MRALVAGMGNVLRRDDGFGVAVAEALAERPLPPDTRVIEVGIGGIHLVQELMEGYDVLVVVDAVDRDAGPGTVYALRPDVPELDPLPEEERRAFLADMHYTVPSKALIMARALGVLPSRVWIVGCQPEDARSPGLGLSRTVRDAVPRAAARVVALLEAARDGAGAECAVGGEPGAPDAAEGDRPEGRLSTGPAPREISS